MRAPSNLRTGEGGFTLIETLVALALMGLVLSALANVTAQWLPNWNRGVDRIQRSEVMSIALQRVADDLAATESVPASSDDKQPLFAGSAQSLTFVRTTLGPNASPGLDVVHFGESKDRDGLATVRSRVTFHPLPPQSSASDQLHFGEPVVLFRAPYQMLFAYAGEDRVWKNTWQNAEKLPARVRLTVRDTSSERAPSLSTVAVIHVQESANGDCKASGSEPQASNQQSGGQQSNGQQQASAQPQSSDCDDDSAAPADSQPASPSSGSAAPSQSGRS